MMSKASNADARSILITGCSSGIGYDAAKQLASRGWRVFATCRKAEDCEKLQSEGLESFRLDYQDEDCIAAALEETLSRTGGTLDALFNNGAFAIPGAVEDVSRDAMREIFEANFFGYHDLTRRIIPTMRSQGHGRIVNCSSILGFITMKWRGAYNSTKFALEGLTDTMRMELSGTPIKIILIEPGPISTRIRENSRAPFEKWVDWENSAFANMYRNQIVPRLYADDLPKDKGELPPEAVTRKLIHAIESPNPRPRYYVTTPTYMAAFMKKILPTRAMDRFLGARS